MGIECLQQRYASCSNGLLSRTHSFIISLRKADAICGRFRAEKQTTLVFVFARFTWMGEKGQSTRTSGELKIRRREGEGKSQIAVFLDSNRIRKLETFICNSEKTCYSGMQKRK